MPGLDLYADILECKGEKVSVLVTSALKTTLSDQGKR